MFWLSLESLVYSQDFMVGNPLSSFRMQEGNTCWAHSTEHLVESMIEKDSGISVKFSNNNHFWFYIFRNRLRQRWINQIPFKDSLQDNKIFEEMGFPEEALKVFFENGITIQLKRKKVNQNFSSQSLLTLKGEVDSINAYKNLNFKKIKNYLEIKDQTIAFLEIDKFLNKAGFKPDSTNLVLVDNIIGNIQGETIDLPSFQNLDELVWVGINSKSPELTNPFLLKTEFGFFSLNKTINPETAQKWIRESLEMNIPVPVNKDAHSTLIIAMDSKFYYVANSQLNKIQKFKFDELDFKVGHFSKALLKTQMSFAN